VERNLGECSSSFFSSSSMIGFLKEGMKDEIQRKLVEKLMKIDGNERRKFL